MERYISTTQLKQGLKEAKRLACDDVLHVTENGRAAYVLCGIEVYERLLEEARARGVWRAGVEDVINTSARDIAEGRVHDLGAIVEYDGRGARPVRIVDSAVRDLEDLRGVLDLSLLASQVERVCDDPAFGLAIEYDGGPQSQVMRKVLVPPYNVLYTYNEASDQIVIRGILGHQGVTP
jgi:hypothetical protein